MARESGVADMMQTRQEFNADMAGVQCSHDTVMILAKATRRTVIKAVVAECKMDDSERLVGSESFSYYTKLWLKQCIRCRPMQKSGLFTDSGRRPTVVWFWCCTSEGIDTCYNEK